MRGVSLVFEPSFIQELKARYGQKPRYQQPALYRLATQPEWADERKQIEQWVRLLPSEKQLQVIDRLRNPDQFYTTYNELIVGDLLRQCGHQPEYERPLGGKTPDWYIPSGKDVPAFFVEVATVYPSQSVQDEARRWDELRSRLEQIQHNFDLHLSADPGTKLLDKDMKCIVAFVNKWLDSFDPNMTSQPQEAVYQEAGVCLRFTLIPRKTRSKANIKTAGPALTWWVSPQPLREALREKLRKYRQVKAERIPLVIALAPTFDSSLDEEALLSVLFGREQLNIYFQNDKIIATKVERDRTGIITPKLQDGEPIVFNTRLSAVLWVTRPRPLSMKVIHNRYACFPLSPPAFKGFPNLVVVEEKEDSYELGWVEG